MVAPDPNWGTGKLRSGPNGEIMGDPAAILEIMRNGDTKQAAAAYRAACDTWQELKDAPGMTDNERRAETIKRALKSINPSIQFTSLTLGH